MLTIKSEQLRPFDVDCNLIFPLNDFDSGPVAYVDDPISKDGSQIKVRINKNMVRLMEEEYARGAYIIVWSRGGWEWARNVVKALGLGHMVSLVLSKPLVYFDDTPVEQWMKDRVFIGPDVAYKNEVKRG